MHACMLALQHPRKATPEDGQCVLTCSLLWVKAMGLSYIQHMPDLPFWLPFRCFITFNAKGLLSSISPRESFRTSLSHSFFFAFFALPLPQIVIRLSKLPMPALSPTDFFWFALTPPVRNKCAGAQQASKMPVCTRSPPSSTRV
jgi:hypothetical protein